ncbi:heterokaryon incompatibility protein-domain-containing protein [Dactylonectria macrodidyma]|uniref:Heterokaryon incompatibility protein-domain-containing protein n=1 Tax=Dactylonectria macrodidyma TaxID=307937 RepID=A0A9P9DDU8_9HYPO|nr:heterokaryon incompatibility protein-domain-containing protein [Dactylonectria macrodidyma]
MDSLDSLDDIPVPHKRLEPGRYIRLLRLHRKLPFQPVRGTLEHVPLDEAPSFVAISYTWGYTDPPYYVILDKVKYCVTGNAHRALCSLSSMWRSRLLWIDSICIDQTNLEERGEQVELMRDIYERAKQTIVCLGAARDAHLAIQLLIELSVATQLHSIHQVLASYKEESSSPRFLALNKLVRNRWFDRVWIVQEVAMSSNIQVYYGNQSLGWETLLGLLLPDLGGAVFSPAMLCQHIFPHHGANGVARDVMEPHHIFLLNAQRQMVKHGKKPPLFHLLYMTLSFEATEKKDQIFALQGISEEGFSRGKADYSEATSARDVFVNTARDILCSELDHRLSLLSVAGVGFGRATTDLPSWVPEWGGGAPTTSSFTNPFISREMSLYDYQAHGKTSPDVSFGVDPDILILGGLYADRIAVIGKASPIQLHNTSVTDPSTHNEHLNRMAQWTEEAWLLAQLHALPEDGTGQPLLEAFWRTCMGDRLIGPSGVCRPAPADCHSYFSAALKMRSNLVHWVKSNEAAPGSFEYYYHTRALDRAFGSREEAVECNRLAQEFEGPMGIHIVRRRFCVTEGGYIGVVPPESQVGDYVCIVYGAQTPFVLRLFDEDEMVNGQMGDIHELVGDCYFHGMMNGEMVAGDVEDQHFAIR